MNRMEKLEEAVKLIKARRDNSYKEFVELDDQLKELKEELLNLEYQTMLPKESNKVHILKTKNPYFTKVWDGIKKFEVRLNDRDYAEGDLLLLKEFEDDLLERKIVVQVTYILNDENYVKEGFVVMGIVLLYKFSDNQFYDECYKKFLESWGISIDQ